MDEANSTGPLDASETTSRSAFRTLAKRIDATNREADTLRRALLEQWADRARIQQLAQQLQSLDAAATDAQLAAWFRFADPGSGELVAGDDALLAGLSDELRARLSTTQRPPG